MTRLDFGPGPLIGTGTGLGGSPGGGRGLGRTNIHHTRGRVLGHPGAGNNDGLP
jgi:hypothetical protein